MVRTVFITVVVMFAVFILAAIQSIRNAGPPMPGPFLKKRDKHK